MNVLGTAVSLASLAIQLLESAEKIKRIYSDTRNAPARLRALAEDVGMTALMLQNLEAYRQQHDIGNDALLWRCTARMRESVESIDALVTALHSRLQRYPIFAKLSVAFKEDYLQRLLDELERSKTSIIVAHQLYMEARHQCDLLEQRRLIATHIDRISDALMAMPQSSMTQFNLRFVSPGLRDDLSAHSPDQTTASVHHRSKCWEQRYTKNRKPPRLYSATIRPWFFGQVWQIAISRSLGEALFCIRSWRIVPESAPIFQACANGDIGMVCEILSSDRATTRDRDVNNQTLLGYASANGHGDLCEFLLTECGFATDEEAVDVAICAMAGNFTKIDFANHLRIFRLFIEHSQLDVLVLKQPVLDKDVPVWWPACPNEDLMDLVLHDQVALDPAKPIFSAELLHIVTESPFEHCRYCPQDPGVMLRLFGSTWHRDGLTRMSLDAKNRFLQVAMIRWHEDLASPSWRLERWKAFVRSLLDVGCDPNAQVAGHTALTRLLGNGNSPARYYIRHDTEGIKRLNVLLQEWTSMLFDAEFNLVRYAEVELRSWATLGISAATQRAAMLTSLPIYDQFVVGGLRAGALPQDWSLMVCRAPVFSLWKQNLIPGSWPRARGMRPDLIRMSGEVDMRAAGYYEARTLDLYSSSLDIRTIANESPDSVQSAPFLLDTSQDDSSAVPLAVLWRRRPSPALKRRASVPSYDYLREATSGTEELRRPRKRQWLPPEHALPTHSLHDAHHCGCLSQPRQEHWQFKPSWYRSLCFRPFDPGSGGHDSADIQDTLRWQNHFFRADARENVASSEEGTKVTLWYRWRENCEGY